MKVAYEGKTPETRTSKQHPHRKILSTGLFLVFVFIFSIDCFQKELRVAVSSENILRANETANEGDAAFGRKDFYTALIRYLAAYRLNSNSEYLCNRLGIAYSQVNLYSKALQAFRRAIALNNKYSYPYNNLGCVYFTQRSYRKAEKYFKKAISLNGKEASFHMNLGSLYLERKNRDKAMAEWRKSLALDPDIFSKRNIASLSSSGSSFMERCFFVARLMAASGNLESAIQNLKLAFNNGFTNIEEINKNPDFDLIRKDERFDQFMRDVAIWLKARPKNGASSDAVRPPLR
jgi:tetratricopeptide (TPR) repeat protein